MIGKCNTGGGENLTTQLNNQDAIITELESKVQSVSGVDMATPVNAQTVTIEQIQESLVDKGAVNKVELTVTPGKDSQEYTPDYGTLYSKVTVTGDSDLVPENIKEGVDIWGVTGTLVKEATVKKGSVTFSGGTASPTLTASIEHGLGVKPTVFGISKVAIKSKASNTLTVNVTASATKLTVTLTDTNAKDDYDTTLTALSWYAGV